MRILWVAALAAATVAWADFWQVASLGTRYSQLDPVIRLGQSLGMAIVPFLTSGIVALVALVIAKNATTALKAWSVALLVVLVFASTGGARYLAN